MRARLLAAPLLLLASAARAALLASGDYAGANLVVANGDTLSGTYTNVGLFSVPAGVTGFLASLASGPNVVVYASTVSIDGVLNGVGRGQPGGGGGDPASGGSSGTAGGTGGAGVGAAAGKGGGGGAGGGAGGAGSGDSGGGVGAAGGGAYGSTGTVTAPISADDAFQGSGGGGGGGGTSVAGGAGAFGGAAIYIEAASMTVTGAILVDGSTSSVVTDGGNEIHPGGGGGGGGGTILLRATNGLTLADGSRLSAKGHGGGSVVSNFSHTGKAPGGGGGGGRIKLFYVTSAFGTVTLSTAAGAAGSVTVTGTADAITPTDSSTGTVSFGVVASSATAFAASAVYTTSISWTWSAAPSFGDALAVSQAYRVFPSSVTAPFPSPQTTASSLATGVTEQSLTPNTTYSRFVTAYSDWGDSAPSNAVSTHTLAEAPSAASFTSVAASALTLSWSGGANPSYTVYETNVSTSSSFAAPVSTSFAAAVSSAPASLAPNTTYYFRARAVNLDGVSTAYVATAATATLAAAPTSPAAAAVHITSAVFTWSAAGNPSGTTYVAEVSTDNFFSLTDSSTTLMTSATFFTLTPGTQNFLRVKAVNRNGVSSAFSTVISTTSGNLSNTSAPSTPGAPVADRAFSYDGTALFAWAEATSSVGILDYNLIIGSLPGASDLFSGSVSVASYSAAGMLTGKSYYAQVRARSNAGVYSVFSPVSSALQVFIPAQNPAIAKPFSWPNPFDPAAGEAQIGFFLEEAADVSLKIYTLQGRLVASRSRSFAAGNQVMSWDGRGESGAKVAPGGYVAVIDKRYGSRSSTQKLKIAVLY